MDKEKTWTKEMEEPQSLFRALVEQSLVGVYLFSEERFLYANEALAKMTGYTVEEITTLKPLDLIHPQDHALVAEMIRKRMAQEVEGVRYTLKGLCKDGRMIYCEVFGRRVIHKGQPAILGTVIDITERVTREEQLQKRVREVEQLKRVAQKLIGFRTQKIWMDKALSLTEEVADADMVVLYQTDKGGLSLAGVYPKGSVDCLKNLFPGECMCGYAAKRGRPHFSSNIFKDLQCILEPCRKGGIISLVALPLKAHDKPLGVLGIGWKHERSFDKEERRFFETLAGEVALAWENALLYQDIHHHAQELEEKVSQRTRELQERVEAEKRLNATLASLLKNLNEANRELEAFAYTVSHDLRAPLRAMEGFSQALLEDCGDKLDDSGHEYARRIIEAAQSMDYLISDLLEYSRLSRQGISLQATDLDRILHQVLDQLSEEVQERKAHIAVEEPLGVVIGHPTLLIHVMSNLLSNALKFVKPEEEPRVRIWSRDKGEKVRLWVEDEGLGIAPQFHGRVFGLFERLHGVESYPGTGVGLAIVKKAVERMGGKSGVRSQESQGSRFWIELEKWREKKDEHQSYPHGGGQPQRRPPHKEGPCQSQDR